MENDEKTNIVFFRWPATLLNSHQHDGYKFVDTLDICHNTHPFKNDLFSQNFTLHRFFYCYFPLGSSSALHQMIEKLASHSHEYSREIF